jgi:hypothetical protein
MDQVGINAHKQTNNQLKANTPTASLAAMASYNAVVAATAKVVHEASLAVIDNLLEFLDSKVEIDDDFKELVAEFKGTLTAPSAKVGKVPKAEKKKREPSAYNLFVRDALNGLKVSQPELSGKDRFREAMKQWKEHKGSSTPSSAQSSDTEDDHAPVKTPIEAETATTPKAKKGKKGKTA